MAEPLEIAAAALPLLGKDDRDKPLAGPAHDRHLRSHPRADRSGALHRQPLIGQSRVMPSLPAAGSGGRLT
jgi:hypothetical protein